MEETKFHTDKKTTIVVKKIPLQFRNIMYTNVNSS